MLLVLFLFLLLLALLYCWIDQVRTSVGGYQIRTFVVAIICFLLVLCSLMWCLALKGENLIHPARWVVYGSRF